MAIAKRKKDSYQIQVITGYKFNNDGIKIPIRYSEMFHGKKSEAKIRESKIKEEIGKGRFCVNKKLTFNDLIDKWYNEDAKVRLQISTLQSYDLMLTEVRKELGNYKLTEMRPIHLVTFYNKLRRPERKLSENSILHYYSMIGRIFHVGVTWGLVDTNINSRVDRPKVKKQEAVYYDEKDIKRLLQCLENEPLKYQVVIQLALDSGCRRGELTGLTWNDVDFNNGTITINKTTQATKIGVIEKECPKNNSSIRTIPIMQHTLYLLEEYYKEQEGLKHKLGNAWLGSNKILIDNYGGRMHPDTPSKIFSKIKKKYDLPPMKFHGLRHTSASIQIALGIHTKVISKRLGHASESTTDMIYSHIFDKLNHEVTDKMTEYLYNKNR